VKLLKNYQLLDILEGVIKLQSEDPNYLMLLVENRYLTQVSQSIADIVNSLKQVTVGTEGDYVDQEKLVEAVADIRQLDSIFKLLQNAQKARGTVSGAILSKACLALMEQNSVLIQSLDRNQEKIARIMNLLLTTNYGVLKNWLLLIFCKEG
jgi:hypothetical protein